MLLGVAAGLRFIPLLWVLFDLPRKPLSQANAEDRIMTFFFQMLQSMFTALR